MNRENELSLIPKYERYIQYMIEVILKMPRTEKFNIGNEYKTILYESMRNVMLLNKIESSKKLYYINLLDADLNTQRVLLRILSKNRWISEKQFNYIIKQIAEIGKILGGLLKFYAKNHKK